MWFDIGSLFKVKSLSGPKKRGGLIGYYDLTEWWLSEFNEKEREYINYQLRTLRWGKNALVADNPGLWDIWKQMHGTRASFLMVIVYNLRKPKDRDLANRVLKEAKKHAEEIKDQFYCCQWDLRINGPLVRKSQELRQRLEMVAMEQIEIVRKLRRSWREIPASPLAYNFMYKIYVREKNQSKADELAKEMSKMGFEMEIAKKS